MRKGQFIKVIVSCNDLRVEFRDSLKKVMGASLKQLGESIGMTK